MNRPEVVTDAMLKYLDALRESGVINMLGAGEYVEAEFGLSKKEAKKVLAYWMQTFTSRKEGRFTWKPGDVKVTAPVDKGEEVFTIDKDIGKVFDFYKGFKAK
jgi:hypothetical protein